MAKKIYRKIFQTIICVILIIQCIFLISCKDEKKENPKTLIGDEGIIFARMISSIYPVRYPGTENENSVADLIVAELKEMGYKPVIQEFDTEKDFSDLDSNSGSDSDKGNSSDKGDSNAKNSKETGGKKNSESGQEISSPDDNHPVLSRNIIVSIKGIGFLESTEKDDEEENRFFKKAVIGVHYDTPFDVDYLQDNPDYDGIHDNASAVGAMISIARGMKEKNYEYDIDLVFFGSGHLGFKGAEYYISNLSEQQIKDIDVMYNIDSIYAGDKLYAHSGLNSLEKGNKYIRRRKLYELSDVALANRIDLRFNESDLDIDLNGDEISDVYREVTSRKSDYSLFDELGISCVYIESYEYFASSVKEQVESKNPYFAETGGTIRGTKFDSAKFLEDILEEDRLETRIKNVAFLIIHALEKGVFR